MKHNKVRHVSTINISKVQMMRIWWIINLGNSVKAPQLVDGVSAQLASTPTLFKKNSALVRGPGSHQSMGPGQKTSAPGLLPIQLIGERGGVRAHLPLPYSIAFLQSPRVSWGPEALDSC